LALEFEWNQRKAAADPRHSFAEERLALPGLSECGRLPAVMYVWKGGLFESSARGRLQAESEGIMKKQLSKGKASKQADADEILPEYDFSRASRNKYAAQYVAGSAVVVLEPDVAAAFPSSQEANQALRALAGIIEKHRSRPTAPRRR
jgi:hypothetical protein